MAKTQYQKERDALFKRIKRYNRSHGTNYKAEFPTYSELKKAGVSESDIEKIADDMRDVRGFKLAEQFTSGGPFVATSEHRISSGEGALYIKTDKGVGDKIGDIRYIDKGEQPYFVNEDTGQLIPNKTLYFASKFGINIEEDRLTNIVINDRASGTVDPTITDDVYKQQIKQAEEDYPSKNPQHDKYIERYNKAKEEIYNIENLIDSYNLDEYERNNLLEEVQELKDKLDDINEDNLDEFFFVNMETEDTKNRVKRFLEKWQEEKDALDNIDNKVYDEEDDTIGIDGGWWDSDWDDSDYSNEEHIDGVDNGHLGIDKNRKLKPKMTREEMDKALYGDDYVPKEKDEFEKALEYAEQSKGNIEEIIESYKGPKFVVINPGSHIGYYVNDDETVSKLKAILNESFSNSTNTVKGCYAWANYMDLMSSDLQTIIDSAVDNYQDNDYSDMLGDIGTILNFGRPLDPDVGMDLKSEINTYDDYDEGWW